MASMASSSINLFAKYPYPSEFINLMDFVPIILLVGNYKEWKQLMLSFIKRLGMVGFIDGTFEAPPHMVTVPDAGGGGDSAASSNTKVIENLDYIAWKRSDNLVRGWILATVSREIGLQVLHSKTAREMWIALERIFDPLIDVEREKLGHCLPLHVAAIKGDWESAKTFIEREPDAVKTPITGLAQTTLVVAIRLARRHEFVKKLLEKMAPEDLALVDSRGRTALHEASIAGNVEAAKLLVQKNLILPNIQDKKGRIPLYYAADFGIRERVLYLLDVTRDDLEPKPFEDKPGVTLLYRLATRGLYGVRIKLENIADHHSQRDIENPADCFISGVVDVKRRLHAMFWDLAENFVPQIKHIREIKLLHHQALELVKRLCTKVVKSNFVRAPMIFTIPLIQATSFGIREIIEEILRSNAMHLAAYMGPLPQLKVSATGAALQMQRELQWFKEVENFSQPQDKERKNDIGMTPTELFTDRHELVKEGERWMKDTANSCTIIATLIATVVFAATITVPGGNNENGHPFFTKQKPFKIFGISDALALFSSIASMLMFLSILTSRYADEDFLYALPNRLIIGLATLFVSILSTMIAFGATLYLVFGDNKAWILIPIVALACLPATLFVALQFPLLKEMTKSTYGPGIFGKQSDQMLF